MTEPKQYEIDIASEYLKDLLTELSSVLDLQINFEVVDKNIVHSGWHDDTKGKAVIFNKLTQDTFILVDCYIEDPTDQIGVVNVIVRCSEKIQIVQSVLLRWYSKCWKRYKRSDINTRLINKYDSSSSLLNRINKERIIIEVN